MDDFDLADKLFVLGVLNDLWDSIATDPDVAPSARLDTFRVRVGQLETRLAAVRAVAPEVIAATSPDTIAEKAARNQHAAATARERGLSLGKRIVELQEADEARKTLAALESDLTTAEDLVQHAEATGSRQEVIIARVGLNETKRMRDEAAAKVAEMSR